MHLAWSDFVPCARYLGQAPITEPWFERFAQLAASTEGHNWDEVNDQLIKAQNASQHMRGRIEQIKE